MAPFLNVHFFGTGKQVPFADEESDIWVREGCLFRDDIVASPHKAVPLERFLHLLGRPQPEATVRPPRAARRQVRQGAREAALERFPWLGREDFAAPAPRRGVAREGARGAGMEPQEEPQQSDGEDSASESEHSHGPADPAGPEVPDVDPDDDAEAFEELAALRAVHEWDAHDPTFFIAGFWEGSGPKMPLEKQQTGAEQRPVRETPQSGAGFLAWPTNRSFMFGRYTREGACTLAREWARRADYFYRLYLESGAPDFRYTDQMVKDFPDSIEFLDFLLSKDVEDHCYIVGQELRSLCPRLG